MLLVHNDIVCAIDRGHFVALLLLDLSSAFDTVDHSAVNTSVSILGHRTVTGMVPFLPDGSYTTVYHPVK